VVCHNNDALCARGDEVSKQSNETYAATDDRDPTTRGLTRRDRNRPNRDEFVEAKNHADEVLGLDEKVSDGLRRAMARFANSPLTLMMEVLNDPDQPWERRFDAAERAKPYLHRKLEDKHGTATQGGGGGGTGPAGGPSGPTINLTVNRPKTTINTVHREVEPAPVGPAAETTATKHEREQRAADNPAPRVVKKAAVKKAARKSR
jgi:hypothetical protein